MVSSGLSVHSLLHSFCMQTIIIIFSLHFYSKTCQVSGKRPGNQYNLSLGAWSSTQAISSWTMWSYNKKQKHSQLLFEPNWILPRDILKNYIIKTLIILWVEDSLLATWMSRCPKDSHFQHFFCHIDWQNIDWDKSPHLFFHTLFFALHPNSPERLEEASHMLP